MKEADARIRTADPFIPSDVLFAPSETTRNPVMQDFLDLRSRRADSNRGPLHYEGRTSEERASTRGRARCMISLEIEPFFGSSSGREYPLVPELSYPFCTRSVRRGSRGRMAGVP